MIEGTHRPPQGGPIEPMACAVCGHVVDTRTEEVGGVEVARTWQHTAATVDDHPVVPVPVDWIRTNYQCDFCLADHARWVLPVEAFGMIDVGDTGYSSEDDWAACDDCASALRARDWNKIIYRAMRTHERVAPERPMPREVWQTLYRQLRQHITGPVRLHVQEPTP